MVLSFVPLNFLDHARRGTVAPSSYLKPYNDQNWQILSKYYYCALNLLAENDKNLTYMLNSLYVAIGSRFTDLQGVQTRYARK